ncbi:MAG TPA: GIY-YIG nuclease family protein [Micavibrio sp.]|jgi:putative endonuclease
MGWVVYILNCADDTLYTGITNDLAKRVALHEQGKGAKYTRGRGPYEVLYREVFDTRSQALRREAAIKSLDRAAKILLARSFPGNLQLTQNNPDT